MKKFIPYDYLLEKASVFPFVYKLVYLKILEDAPVGGVYNVKQGETDNQELFRDAYEAGYECGLKDGVDLGLFGSQHEADETEKPRRRPIK